MSFSYWRQRRRIFLVVLIGTLIGLDQVTKAYFANSVAQGHAIPVTDWFNLVHLLNKGAAFSMFANADGWQRPLLICVGILVILPMTFICLSERTQSLERWPAGMLVAGGAGNLIDRVQSGAVVDFLDLHWRGWHWPAFNLADIYIVCAALCWLLLSQKKTIKLTATEIESKVRS